MIDLASIYEDPGVQLRDSLNNARVEEMIVFLREGGVLPPITVVGDNNLLADGHHRKAACERMGKLEIDCNRVPGGKPEAVAYAIKGNDSKGNLPNTGPQRNKGITLLLNAGWSQKKIAEATGLSQQTINYVVASRAAVAAFPALPTATAIEVAGIGGRPRSGRNQYGAGQEEETNIGSLPLQQEVAIAVKGMEFQPVRQIVRQVNTALRNGITPDVPAIVASVQPTIRVATPYTVYEEVKRRFVAFNRSIVYNGQELSIADAIATIMENPDAEELRPYTFINEPAAEYLREAAQGVIDMLSRIIAPAAIGGEGV